MCQGYYNHAKPYRPEWPGLDRFQGLLVHPQSWPEDLDLAGKRVVVIGSGATAATLIPAIAEEAAARHDAAALPHLLPRPAHDPRARRDAARAGRPRGVDARDHAPPVHAADQLAGQDVVRGARRGARVPHGVHAPAAARGLRHREALHPPLPPVAAAHRRRPGRRPVRRPARGQRRRSSPTPSRRSPSTGSGSAPARRSRPTSSSPPPASTCRSSATSRSPSTTSRSTSPSASPGAA